MRKKLVASMLSASIITGAMAAPTASFASSLLQDGKEVSVSPVSPIQSPIPKNDSGNSEQNIISNVIKKAITNAIRHGGPFLNKLLSKVSPSAGKYVEKYANKLADFLDTLTDWQEVTVANYLVSLGVPPAEAANIAYYVVFLAGF